MAATVERKKQSDMLREIRDETIPLDIKPLIKRYDEVTMDRNQLLWKWLWHVFPRFRLSSVSEDSTGSARRAKFCFSMYMTVLDDISENHRDRSTFEAGRRIPFQDGSVEADHPDTDAEILDLLNRVWAETERHLREAPRSERFRELFEFDLRQSLNTMDYNRLINEGPQMANRSGITRYDTHNMLLFLYVDIDLAFSPAFEAAELGTLRDITWEAQKLARIGNWITTWERELREDDYTSKVIVEAMERGVVSREELQSETVPDEAIVQRLKDTSIEHDLLLDWNNIYGRLRTRDHGLETVDVEDFLDGMRYLLEVDVKMRGYK
jgi:hypothetical protein